MSYFFFQNSEDGLRCDGPYTNTEAVERIEELTSEDLRPECRAEFVTKMPDDYTDTKFVTIVKGEVVTPQARQRVTEWSL